MAFFKATVTFSNSAECWVEAEDAAAATAAFETATEADLRQMTLWLDMFQNLTILEVSAVEEG